LKETVEIIRALLTGDALDFNGECFKLSRFKLGFKPVRSDVPIYVAGLGLRSLRQVGEVADGWLPTHWPRTKLSEGIAEIRASAEAVGRDVSRIEVAPFVNVVLSDDVARALNSARMPLAYYIGGMGDYYHAALSRLGFSAEADRVRELWQAGRPKDAIRAVTDEMIDGIAICGPLDVCQRRLDETIQSGATLVLVPIPQEGTIAEKCRVIQSLIA
jgi:alkanesulfonate monooxygenase SsuD/methylene tetrahydromethanopterin reductase-like flavin-dependent oxidoreductase (luciferase family)